MLTRYLLLTMTAWAIINGIIWSLDVIYDENTPTLRNVTIRNNGASDIEIILTNSGGKTKTEAISQLGIKSFSIYWGPGFALSDGNFSIKRGGSTILSYSQLLSGIPDKSPTVVSIKKKHKDNTRYDYFPLIRKRGFDVIEYDIDIR